MQLANNSSYPGDIINRGLIEEKSAKALVSKQGMNKRASSGSRANWSLLCQCM